MIVSASYRTDIPAFYGAWFENRLRAGYCAVANPYGGKPYHVALDRDSVSGLVFWTRNPRPFLPTLARVADVGYPFVVQITVTGYPHNLETSVPKPARVIEDAQQIAWEFGTRAMVWRYNPIIETDASPLGMHGENFSRLADAMAGATDEVVVSFANLYRKTIRNLDRNGLAYSAPTIEVKKTILTELAKIAAGRAIGLTICSQPELAANGTKPTRCIDARRLTDVAGRTITARQKGNRPGCTCYLSRDIGAYDSCPHRCVYCYAVESRSKGRRQYARHDPAGEFLI